MLEQVAGMYDNMKPMLKKLKKKSYEQNMKMFREQYGHYLNDMMDYISRNENKKEAAKEISEIFCERVKESFAVRGKIKGVVQMDLNLFSVYYIFPAIMLSYHDEAKMLADTLCETWNSAFKDGKIGYTDYNTLYNKFNEKIFGIF